MTLPVILFGIACVAVLATAWYYADELSDGNIGDER